MLLLGPIRHIGRNQSEDRVVRYPSVCDLGRRTTRRDSEALQPAAGPPGFCMARPPSPSFKTKPLTYSSGLSNGE